VVSGLKSVKAADLRVRNLVTGRTLVTMVTAVIVVVTH